MGNNVACRSAYVISEVPITEIALVSGRNAFHTDVNLKNISDLRTLSCKTVK